MYIGDSCWNFQVFRSTFLWTTLRHGNVIYFQCTYLVPFLRFRWYSSASFWWVEVIMVFGEDIFWKKVFFCWKLKETIAYWPSKLSFWNSRVFSYVDEVLKEKGGEFCGKSLDNLSGCFCLFISVACYTVWDRSSIRVLSGNDCSCELIITIITLAIPES